MILENELFLTYHAEYEIKIESHVSNGKMFISLVIRHKK